MWPTVLTLLLASAAPESAVCPTSLSLDDALALAAERSPLARAMARAVSERRALDDEIPLFLGNPQLQISSGPRVVPSNDFGLEGSVGLYAPLDVSGRGFVERERAAQSRAALLAEREQAALEARLQATDDWFALWEAERARELAEGELELATELEAAIERAAQSAALSSADAARARRYTSEVRLEVTRLQGEVFERGLALGGALGCGPVRALAADAPHAPPIAEAIDASHAERHPAARARDHAARAVRKREEALARDAWSGLSLGVVTEKDGPKTYRGLLELQVPLPVFDRGQAERADAAAEAARLEGESDVLRRAARIELERALHEIEHSRELLDVARQALVPAAEEAERLETLAFEVGASTLVERLRARADRLSATRALLAAEAAHAKARWRLALLSQALEGATPAEGAPAP